MAGINAALRVRREDNFVLGRSEAYIGVMIDDLVTLGTREPYRMFTSRAEYRLLLREDNADLRLREKGHALGIVPEEEYGAFLRKREEIAVELDRVRQAKILPSADPLVLEEFDLVGMQNAMTFEQLLRRPDFTYADLAKIDAESREIPAKIAEQVEIQIKYQGYIDRQLEHVARARKLEGARIPDEFDYAGISGLTAEVREKLMHFRPDTLGQASRIQGVTPAAISLLSISLKARSAK
jgi:tRNA uridine 5-carboxymethylaminomethyl modification enzyme